MAGAIQIHLEGAPNEQPQKCPINASRSSPFGTPSARRRSASCRSRPSLGGDRPHRLQTAASIPARGPGELAESNLKTTALPSPDPSQTRRTSHRTPAPAPDLPPDCPAVGPGTNKTLGLRFSRVLTDNGAAYRSNRFKRLCQRLGLRHLRTRPYHLRINGKAERYIQTALREWAYARACPNSDLRAQQMLDWLH
jgi:hypothetical protein